MNDPTITTTSVYLTALEQQHEDQALGAAWRRCEAALPEGWRFLGVRTRGDETWTAGAQAESIVTGNGPTPTEALTALAEALEARAAE